jgi:NADH-quinone oxidoreductase subunit C
MTPEQMADQIRARYPDTFVARGEVTVQVGRDDLWSTLKFLRDDPVLSLGFLSCVTATDWPGKDPRFWVVYELRSIPHRHRVRVKVGLAEHDPHVPSITTMFPTANWHERETFDFYGIVFDGHPDLTRILLPDDWEGYPLRKTEELGGVNTRYHGAFIPPVDTRIGT